jgi:antitoxin component YwqK of YwqJK toxin-antitoxin module
VRRSHGARSLARAERATTQQAEAWRPELVAERSDATAQGGTPSIRGMASIGEHPRASASIEHPLNLPAPTNSKMKKFYPNGQIKSIHHKKQGVWHNTDGPARVEFYPNGRIQILEYWRRGARHNNGGPAIYHMQHDEDVRTIYNRLLDKRNSDRDRRQKSKWHKAGAKVHITSSVAIIKEYWQNGGRHRIGGPAIIVMIEGVIVKEEYWRGGKLHRGSEEPAIISQYPYLKCEHYYVNGVPHRVGAPALNTWHKNGQKRSEYWCDCGNEGRTEHYDIRWKKNGEIREVSCADYIFKGNMIIKGNGNCRYIEAYIDDCGNFYYLPWAEGMLYYGCAAVFARYSGRSITVDWRQRISHYIVVKNKDKLCALQHNTTGPAEIDRLGNGAYYIMGEKLSEEEWRQRIFPPAIKEQIYILPQPIAEEICEYFTAI